MHIDQVEGKGLKILNFKVKTIHGQTDVYVSKENRYPSSNDEADQWALKTIERPFTSVIYMEGDLNGDFFIGVKGFHPDSSVEIEVSKEYVDGSNFGTGGDGSTYTLLREGYEHEDQIGDNNSKFYRFEINMPTGQEQTILFDFESRGMRNTKAYLSFGQEPSERSHDYELRRNHQLVIQPRDPAFHRRGTYYILVKSFSNDIQKFLDAYVYSKSDTKYSLKYSIGGKIQHVIATHATQYTASRD